MITSRLAIILTRLVILLGNLSVPCTGCVTLDRLCTYLYSMLTPFLFSEQHNSKSTLHFLLCVSPTSTLSMTPRKEMGTRSYCNLILVEGISIQFVGWVHTLTITDRGTWFTWNHLTHYHSNHCSQSCVVSVCIPYLHIGQAVVMILMWASGDGGRWKRDVDGRVWLSNLISPSSSSMTSRQMERGYCFINR